MPLAVARRRYEERGAADSRHAVHVEGGGDEAWEFWSGVAEPLALGRVHRVDTTRPVDVPALASRINVVR